MKSDLTPAYGWGPIGQRVAGLAPHGHRQTITFPAAVRSTGLIAPPVVDGAMSGESFRACVRQHSTKGLRPGDFVAMGNLPSRKVAGVAEAIRGVGAGAVHLLPYRPDPNPIEQVSSKAEAEIRQRKPRTVAAAEQPCGDATDGCPAASAGGTSAMPATARKDQGEDGLA